MNDRIVESKLYGEHISLYCVNHPHLRWSTKNIDCIGARTIFYSSKDLPECNCSTAHLRPVVEVS